MAKQGTWAGRDVALTTFFGGLLALTVGGVVTGSSWPFTPGATAPVGLFVLGLFMLAVGAMLTMVGVVAVGVRIGLDETD
jgi:hypothetical protein